jgi:2-C-methyl-D-erythritol 2,4-cyclodiphosphate synthase
MFRNGIGFDAHRFAKGRRLILGGVEIEHPVGLLGHSDADVLCHAVMDALLGAIADGDIGKHFPDSDARWKDANSVDLLRLVTERLRSKDWAVVNVDVTVLAESPKLAPHVDNMRANMAEAMGITTERVSIKATTLEGMGALGRKEGIAVMAVASVQKVLGGRY